MLLGGPYVCYAGPSLMVAYFRQYGKCASPWVIGCQAPSCTKRLAAAGGPSHKAAGSGSPGLVLACSRAVLGSRWMTFGLLAFLDLVLACWWVGLVPYMTGYKS